MPFLSRAIPFLFSLPLFLALPSPVSAQSDSGISIAAGAHALTVPWYPGPVSTHFNPAVMVGADHDWKSRDNWRLYYAINLGFLRHHWWMTGISLEPEVGISRFLPGGFHADLRLGLGYMHYFWRRKTFELEDGRYVEATDWGKPSLILPLSATVGYRGDPDRPVSVAPFVSLRWAVQGLFLEEVPAVSHLSVLGGIRVERGRDSSEEGR